METLETFKVVIDTKGDTSIDIPGLEKEIKKLLKSLYVVEVSHQEEGENAGK